MTTQTSPPDDVPSTAHLIAEELGLPARQVVAAIELLQSGNTVPFIARYRKEATSGLDEVALRALEDALERTTLLAARRATVLKSIDQQGALTDHLRRQIEACRDLHSLEALYLPFKPKRRTRATAAREQGLQPLADLLLRQGPLPGSRQETLHAFVDRAKGVPDPPSALQGALDILAEQWSEDAATRTFLLDLARTRGQIYSKLKRGQQDTSGKFELYTNHQEPVRRIPSHRILAMLRGASEGLLRVGLLLDESLVLPSLTRRLVTNHHFEFYPELVATVEDCVRRLLLPATESALLQVLKEKADEEAIGVFGKNLRDLLMAPPAGPRVTMGIDPGFRTGCKVAVVDATGKFLESATIYPTPPRNDSAAAGKTLLDLIDRLGVELIAIGNGTASRETDHFLGALLRDQTRTVTKVMVSEAGASIYSASELAIREFPHLDVTVRGAISIARRLQDPLAELVKADPKSIGVGQYQHDVNQPQLRKCLDRVVESCVNQVGVDLNMASVPLLSYVAGIGPKLAERIVAYRDDHGRFTNRHQLMQVEKLGKKAFEQAAGFLRIRGGDQPLDDSAVHPECYPIVGRMADKLGTETKSLVGNATLSRKLTAEEFVDGRHGLPTISDILEELAKPGRDPRSEFKAARFQDGVQHVDDLRPGMVLEGVITNVTHFGAFVDIGVHQDGLVHVSQLADEFVKDPNEFVSVGDVVNVKVVEVDAVRKRISLTRKLGG